MTSKYNKEDYLIDNDDDEYLTRVVIDTCGRKFYMYSNEGDTRIIEADTTQQFMDILEVIRAVCDEDIVGYSDPMVAG